LGRALQFPLYFGTTTNSTISSVLTFNHHPAIAVGTILGFPGIPAWGSNGALWSLKYEIWFYLLYPIFWLLSRQSFRLSAVGMGIGFLVGIAPIGEIHVITIVLVYWGIWCLGAFLADVYVGRTCLTLGNISLMSILLIIMPIADHAFSLSGGNIHIGLIRELLWGIGFMGLIAAALTWKRQGGSLVLLEYLKPFGNFSYTLYVLHLPILVFISAYLQAKNSTLPRF